MSGTLEASDLVTLASIPFFAGLDKGRHRRALAVLRRVDCPAGEAMFRESEAARGLFMLGQGSVRLERRANGHTIPLGGAHAPVSLMPVGLFDGGPNGMTATALSDCVAYLLKKADFERLCLHQPDVHTGLLRAFAGRQRELTSAVEMIAGSSVRERLARILVNMAVDGKTNDLTLPCHQGSFAALLGTVREVLSRSLKHLEDEGLIEADGIRVVVRDLDGLRRAAGPAMAAGFVSVPLAFKPCFTDAAVLRYKGPH